MSLSLTLINNTFAAPLFVTSPQSDPQFLFVVEKGGTIKVVQRSTNAVINTFLDVSGLVSTSGERGLLGLAFDPQYQANGRVYISYTDQNSALVVARYLRDPVFDLEVLPNADAIILTIPNPAENLFGGMLAFGPDGFLYISRGHGGDFGGAIGDPNNESQNLGSLLGKMLRINVNVDEFPGDAANNYGIPADNPCVGQAGARGEIWSMGLRNAWRFSFDRGTGDMYVADVGHTSREEINVATVADGAGRGNNYGWRIMEGKSCFNPDSNCNTDRISQPALEYSHDGGACSVIGGYVYRGTAIPGLAGTYFYGDLCLGFVRSFRYNGQVSEHSQWPLPSPGAITSFGEDALGELYITTFEGGLYRISQ